MAHQVAKRVLLYVVLCGVAVSYCCDKLVQNLVAYNTNLITHDSVIWAGLSWAVMLGSTEGPLVWHLLMLHGG